MSDYDRYDLAITLLIGAIMNGVVLLGGPVWTMPLFLALAVTISLYRHLDLPPRRR